MSSDAVHVRVDFPANTPLPTLTHIARAFTVRAALLAHKHVWSHDPLEWRVAPSPARLVARVRYGECIEDEWVVTWLCVALSGGAAASDFSGDAGGVDAAAVAATAVFHMDDAGDGDFLLIEAANVLPKWASRGAPAALRYRTLIFGGAVHLISPDALAGAPPTLEAAAAHVRLASPATLAPEGVRAALDARIGRFPGGLVTLRHSARALVPAPAALLFAAVPALVSAAADAFLTREPREMSRAATFAHLTGSAPPLAAALDAGVTADALVCVSATLPRVHFAQILSARALPPARSIFAAAAADAPRAQAAALGFALSAGLEILMQRGRGPAVARAIAAAVEAAATGGAAAFDSDAFAESRVPCEARFAPLAADDDGDVLAQCGWDPVLIMGDVALDRLRARTSGVAAAAFYKFVWPPPRALADDSSEWMRADVADAEVSEYLRRAAAAAGAGGGSGEGESSADGGARVVDELSGFFARVSSHEGADVKDAGTGDGADGADSGESDDESTTDGEGEGDEGGGDNCKGSSSGAAAGTYSTPPAHFTPLLSKALLLDLLSAASADVGVPAHVAAALAAHPLPPLPVEDERMAWLAGESDQDSDMARVFAAMDAELGQSAALERLPDGGGGGARQALLAAAVSQSVAAQAGAAGPTTNILGSIGAEVPPEWVKGREDS